MGSTTPVKYLKGGEEKKKRNQPSKQARNHILPEVCWVWRIGRKFCSWSPGSKRKGRIRISLCEAVSLMTNYKHFATLQKKAGENNEDMGMRDTPCIAIPSIILLELRQHWVHKSMFSQAVLGFLHTGMGVTLLLMWGGCSKSFFLEQTWHRWENETVSYPHWPTSLFCKMIRFSMHLPNPCVLVWTH